MIPNVDERLASLVRAVSDVILPSLPGDASLAQEQAQLVIGHLQILRAQIDAVPAYEREEREDAIALARALLAVAGIDSAAGRQAGALREAVDKGESHNDVRAARIAINAAISALIEVAYGSDDRMRSSVHDIVIQYESRRATKDREWFAPFGFEGG